MNISRINMMGGSALSLLAHVTRMADEGEPLGIIELGTNLDEVEKPEELPPGGYVGEVQGVESKVSEKGNTYFAIKFRIGPDQIPADVADSFEDGAIMFYNRIIVPKEGDRRAQYNLKRFITALGLNTNTSQVDPNDWMGQEARLNIVHEKYQGETRAQIKSVESAEKAAPKTVGAKVGKAAAAPAANKRRGR